MLVGEDKKQFVVHRDIICKRSTFFKAASSQRWSNGPVELPDDLPQVFETFLYCVYKDQVPTEAPDPPYEEVVVADQQPTQAHRHLVRVYVLADKLGDITTANLVMEDMQKRFKNFYHPRLSHTSVLSLVLATTAEDSPMQNLFIDFFVFDAEWRWVDALRDDDAISKNFICKILQERLRLSGDENKKAGRIKCGCSPGPRQTSIYECRYRLHDEEHSSCGDKCRANLATLFLQSLVDDD